MFVADLLTDESLRLRLHTPSSRARLASRITWCAPTEFMDPTPFLSPNVLLLTNGIGLKIEDDRTWDAYVERLAKVPVAAIAFGTGAAHSALPPGLVKACSYWDVPLLEIPVRVPFLQVHRLVSKQLQAEQFATMTQGWDLANLCARLTASGATLRTVLAKVSKAAGGPLAIFDGEGSVIARWPESSAWSDEDLHRAVMHDEGSRIPLPMGAADSFNMVVRRNRGGLPLDALLGPATSIIAVQMTNALQTASRKENQLETVILQALDWQGVTLDEFTRTFKSTGLDARLPTFLVLAATPEGSLSDVWRVRLSLQDAFGTLRIVVRDDTLFAFAQQPRSDSPHTRQDADLANSLLEGFRRIAPHLPLVVNRRCDSVEELRLQIFHARQLLERTERPRLAPELSLDSLLVATAGHGTRIAAEKFLAPIIDHDRQRSGHLLETLKAHLANDCQPSKTCQALFIHRNTLAYRLRKLESLLGLPLDTLVGQSTSLMALRIVDATRTPAAPSSNASS